MLTRSRSSRRDLKKIEKKEVRDLEVARRSWEERRGQVMLAAEGSQMIGVVDEELAGLLSGLQVCDGDGVIAEMLGGLQACDGDDVMAE